MESLLNHIQNFQEPLINMDIFEKIRQLDLLCEIASNAAGMDKDAFIAIAIVKGICREARDRNREDGIARAERESMEVKAKQIPATKSSIDALGREVFNDSGSATDCIVCMEEIEAGDVAIRMPCSHVYHSDCIVKWLQICHMCPLCRYHMPCEFG